MWTRLIRARRYQEAAAAADWMRSRGISRGDAVREEQLGAAAAHRALEPIPSPCRVDAWPDFERRRDNGRFDPGSCGSRPPLEKQSPKRAILRADEPVAARAQLDPAGDAGLLGARPSKLSPRGSCERIIIGSLWQRRADMDGNIFAGSEHETSGHIRMPKVRYTLRSLSALRPEVAAQLAKTPVAIAVPVTGR